jgi:serine/threonine protein kinase
MNDTTLVKIGAGHYGTVYYDVATKYCIKLANSPRDVDFVKEAQRQMLVATRLGIAPQVNSYTEEYIEMEYIDGLTVCEYREKTRDDWAFEDKMGHYLEQLESIGVPYRDWHDENFMVDKKGKLWLIDFGI